MVECCIFEEIEMFELNKFKIVTLCIILMFIFAIAAMYSNTKDVVKDRGGHQDSYSQRTNYYPEQRSSKKNNVSASMVNDLSNRISALEESVANMDTDNSDKDKFNCSIQGFMSGDILVPVSESDSLKEAKENGKEIVMLCSFK